MSDADRAPLYVIDDDPQVDWPVQVRLPVDGGDFAVFEFTVRLRVLSEAGYTSLLATPAAVEGQAIDDEPMPATLARNAERFAQVVTGWEGVTRADGSAVPFTPEALRAQVTGPRGVWLSIGIYQAINEVRYGARLGNFAPPSVAG